MSKRSLHQVPSQPVLAALLATVLLATACGRGGGDEAVTTTTLSGISDGVALVQLEGLLIHEVPAGFVVLPEDTSDTGPTDLGAAVAAQGSQGDAELVRAFFEANEFTGGYQRIWADSLSGRTLLVFLYQYAASVGAASQADVIRSGLLLQQVQGSREFDTGIPQSFGLIVPQDGLWLGAVSFAKGDHWSMIRLVDFDANQAETQARRLAREQFDRLP